MVPSPNLGAASWLNGVVKVTANNIWAVGAYHIESSGANESLIEHWDGTTWSIAASSGGNDDILDAVTRVPGTNQIWTAGYDYTYTSQGYTAVPLSQYWDGTTWRSIYGPTNTLGVLYGVTAITTKNIWAVGSLIEHWNGASWSVVSGLPPGSATVLNAVTQVPGTKFLFAVGHDANSTGLQTLIETACS